MVEDYPVVEDRPEVEEVEDRPAVEDHQEVEEVDRHPEAEDLRFPQGHHSFHQLFQLRPLQEEVHHQDHQDLRYQQDPAPPGLLRADSS